MSLLSVLRYPAEAHHRLKKRSIELTTVEMSEKKYDTIAQHTTRHDNFADKQ